MKAGFQEIPNVHGKLQAEGGSECFEFHLKQKWIHFTTTMLLLFLRCFGGVCLVVNYGREKEICNKNSLRRNGPQSPTTIPCSLQQKVSAGAQSEDPRQVSGAHLGLQLPRPKPLCWLCSHLQTLWPNCPPAQLPLGRQDFISHDTCQPHRTCWARAMCNIMSLCPWKNRVIPQ